MNSFGRGELDMDVNAGISSFGEYVYRKRDCDWIMQWSIFSLRSMIMPLFEIPGDIFPENHNPNLTLNIGIKSYPTWVLICTATVGATMQVGILIWAGISRYSLGWIRDDIQGRYAVIVLLIGTVFLSFGLFLCALMIERSTEELTFRRRSDKPQTSRMYWVQPGTQFIGDQAFDSFACSHPKNRFSTYHSSWKKTPYSPRTLFVYVAVSFAVVGFVLQFLGLRACHSSVSVAQLYLTLFMSAARAALRSNRLDERHVCLTDKPDINAGRELDWLALHIGYMDHPLNSRNWAVSGRRYDQQVESVITRFEDTTLLQISIGNATRCTVTGFRRDSILASNSPAARSENHKLLLWQYRHLITVEQQDPRPKVTMDEIGMVLLYRSRLAILTQDWADHLVKSRKWARSLQKALKTTVNLLFTTEVTLEDGWDSSIRIYCAVPCEMPDQQRQRSIASQIDFKKPESLREDKGFFYVGFSREDPTGVWSVAEPAHLEALLGLWSWCTQDDSIKSRIFSISTFHQADASMVSVDLPDLRAWGMEHHLYTFPPGHTPTFGSHNIPRNGEDQPLIGYHMSRRIPTDDSRKIQTFARESFSIIFASLLRIVHSIGGTTTAAGGKITNSNITKIQETFTSSGLGPAAKAMACIIPAFKVQGKLPTVEPQGSQAPGPQKSQG